MKTKPWTSLLTGTLLWCLLATTPGLLAQDAPDATPEDEPTLRRLDEPADEIEPAAPPVPADEVTPPTPPATPEPPRSPAVAGVNRGVIFRLKSDIHVPAGQSADNVVAIFGNIVVDGEVHDETVAVFGDITVNGRTNSETVAVMGDLNVEGRVNGDAIAVMGRLNLGPRGTVDGDSVVVGGTLDIVPGGVIDGETVHVELPAGLVSFARGLRVWFYECLFLGRPLAFNAQLMWAWSLAAGFLVFYLLLVLMFGGPMTTCAETLEKRPGMTVVASVLTALFVPILTVLLSFLAVGVLVPILMFIVGLFGKAAFLLWMGRRVLRPERGYPPFAAAAVGGVILTLTYTVPILGFVMMKVSGLLGTGMIVYAILFAMQSERNSRPTAAAAMPAGAGASGAATTMASVPTSAADPATGVASSVEPTPLAEEPPPIPSEPPPVPPAAAVPPPAAAPKSATAGLQFSLLPRAGFWIRLAACLLDVVLVGVILGVVGFGDYFVPWFALYSVVLWALKGTTIGGVVCGLKIVRLDDRNVDWSVAVVRGLGAFLSFVVLGLGFIWVAFDEDCQSWHDKIAGTTIVRVPKGVSLI